ncbi:membrane protein [Candidatus Omnitrophus magneticus]|uniref:Membrane protein n=1 Tax=Candidatus Omnitrophus magneticus TaxID=1609969 RepID=A0A0F0CUN4_9BACT|nr:membrane protein [Candidatus Omnitrophus magneticus]
MESIFNNLPLTTVLLGNIIISWIGIFFLWGAPVKTEYRGLKLSFVMFWIFIIIYYLCRAGVEYYFISTSRFICFLSPTGEGIHPKILPDFLWLLLVITADFSAIALLIGGIIHFTRNRRYLKIAVLLSFFGFISAWISAGYLKHNSVSAVITFLVFIYLGWRVRIKYITSSVLFIGYAFLNLPFFLLSGNAPEALKHTIFTLLFVSKFSLIVAMYNVLGVSGKIE